MYLIDIFILKSSKSFQKVVIIHKFGENVTIDCLLKQRKLTYTYLDMKSVIRSGRNGRVKIKKCVGIPFTFEIGYRVFG